VQSLKEPDAEGIERSSPVEQEPSLASVFLFRSCNRRTTRVVQHLFVLTINLDSQMYSEILVLDFFNEHLVEILIFVEKLCQLFSSMIFQGYPVSLPQCLKLFLWGPSP
jgi:hypothetical protein